MLCCLCCYERQVTEQAHLILRAQVWVVVLSCCSWWGELLLLTPQRDWRISAAQLVTDLVMKCRHDADLLPSVDCAIDAARTLVARTRYVGGLCCYVSPATLLKAVPPLKTTRFGAPNSVCRDTVEQRGCLRMSSRPSLSRGSDSTEGSICRSCEAGLASAA